MGKSSSSSSCDTFTSISFDGSSQKSVHDIAEKVWNANHYTGIKFRGPTIKLAIGLSVAYNLFLGGCMGTCSYQTVAPERTFCLISWVTLRINHGITSHMITAFGGGGAPGG